MTQTLVFEVGALREAVQRGDTFDYRLFWGHHARRDGALSDACFSQWWPCAFALDGVSYSSAEQYMMAEKARAFSDAEILAQILATSDSAVQKQLGRGVHLYDEGVWTRIPLDVKSRPRKCARSRSTPAAFAATGTTSSVHARRSLNRSTCSYAGP